MQKLSFFIILLFLGCACSVQKGIIKVDKSEAVSENDSIEYELVTSDSKFESWYVMYSSPVNYRSIEFYESWNRQYVSAWNFNATQLSRGNFFEPIIGYDPDADYGIEINHKLFYHFQYVENILKIEIMPNSPKSVVF